MEGILVGCDAEQEWLLPWWHSNLRKHNPELPIAFGDLGMSKEGVDWCKKRGILIPRLPPLSKDAPPWIYEGRQWATDPLPSQFTWFEKPFLMQQSPFRKTVWLDLDCEVLGDLSPLFFFELQGTKFAATNLSNSFKMFSEDKQECMEIKRVNSGVIVYEKGSELLDFWAELTRKTYLNFFSDDCILAFAISKYSFPLARIPCKYNWLILWGKNPEALILHWEGKIAKTVLKNEVDAGSPFSYRQFPLLAIKNEFLRRA